jgi:hypothetical protein
MNDIERHLGARATNIIICLMILFFVFSLPLLYGCKSSNTEEMHILVYTGDYSTNEYKVRNDVIITDKIKISSVLDYFTKIKDECPSNKPSTKVLSKMMHLFYKGKTMILYSQGHDKFYLYEKASNNYFYLGSYYEKNYYAPFRKIIFDVANIQN